MSDDKTNRGGKMFWSPELRSHRLTADEREALVNWHVEARAAAAADQRRRHRGRVTARKNIPLLVTSGGD